jgi:hypothetical protein
MRGLLKILGNGLFGKKKVLTKRNSLHIDATAQTATLSCLLSLGEV